MSWKVCHLFKDILLVSIFQSFVRDLIYFIMSYFLWYINRQNAAILQKYGSSFFFQIWDSLFWRQTLVIMVWEHKFRLFQILCPNTVMVSERFIEVKPRKSLIKTLVSFYHKTNTSKYSTLITNFINNFVGQLGSSFESLTCLTQDYLGVCGK